MAGTLVIHPGALGDVLLAIPALRALRGAVDPDDAPAARTRVMRLAGARRARLGGARPTAERQGGPLTLAAQPRIGVLLRALGVVDDAVSFDSLGLDALFVDGGADRDVPAVAEASRVVCWFGAKDPDFVRRLKAIARDAIVAPPASGENLVWAHLLRTVSTRVDCQVVPVPIEFLDEGLDALRSAGWDVEQPLLMVHPGAGGVGKRWPVESFVATIERFTTNHEFTVCVHEGPADHEPVTAIRKFMHEPIVWLDNPSLLALAGALAHASLYLGNDSGVSHLAAAVGARSVVLFTADALPWQPWSPTADCVVVSTTSAPGTTSGATVMPAEAASEEIDRVVTALDRIAAGE